MVAWQAERSSTAPVFPSCPVLLTLCATKAPLGATMEERWRNVFDWLDHVRNRPEMWLRQRSLTELQSLVWGYYTGLSVHGILEPVPSMNRNFMFWLHYRTTWSCSGGWALAINERYSDADEAFAVFFKWADEYRRLKPATLRTVRLAARHNPTGHRMRSGLDGLMEKPQRVDIVRYRPEPLHFLRFYYPDRVEDGDLLMTGNGDYATTIRYAKLWVRDELQVELAAWRELKRRRESKRRRS